MWTNTNINMNTSVWIKVHQSKSGLEPLRTLQSTSLTFSSNKLGSFQICPWKTNRSPTSFRRGYAKSISLYPDKKMGFCTIFPGPMWLTLWTLQWKWRRHRISMVLPHPLDSQQDFKLWQGLSMVKFTVISNEAARLFPFKLNEQKKKMSTSDYYSASFKEQEQTLITCQLCVRYGLTRCVISSSAHYFGGGGWLIGTHFPLSRQFVISVI